MLLRTCTGSSNHRAITYGSLLRWAGCSSRLAEIRTWSVSITFVLELWGFALDMSWQGGPAKMTDTAPGQGSLLSRFSLLIKCFRTRLPPLARIASVGSHNVRDSVLQQKKSFVSTLHCV